MYGEGESSQGRDGLTGTLRDPRRQLGGGDSGGLASAAPPGAPPNALQPACRAEPAFLGTVLLFPSPCPCAGTFPVGRGLGPSFGRGFLTVARAGCPGCHPWALCSLSCPGPRGLGPWCPYSLTVT